MTASKSTTSYVVSEIGVGDASHTLSMYQSGMTSVGGLGLTGVSDFGLSFVFSNDSNSGAAVGTLQYAPNDVHAGKTPHLVHMFNNFAIDGDLDTLAAIIPIGNPANVVTIGS